MIRDFRIPSITSLVLITAVISGCGNNPPAGSATTQTTAQTTASQASQTAAGATQEAAKPAATAPANGATQASASPGASSAASASPAANPLLDKASAQPGKMVMGNGGQIGGGTAPALPPNIMESVTKPLSREKFKTLPKETQEMILKATGGKIPGDMVATPPKQEQKKN